jgi:hypothetical protein
VICPYADEESVVCDCDPDRGIECVVSEHENHQANVCGYSNTTPYSPSPSPSVRGALSEMKRDGWRWTEIF